METWQNIYSHRLLDKTGYFNYAVSDLGNLRILRYNVGSDIPCSYSPLEHTGGFVKLHTPDGKIERLRVDRLVAGAFLSNPHNFVFLVHKDGDMDNNCADNLVWCERPSLSNDKADESKRGNTCRTESGSTGSNKAEKPVRAPRRRPVKQFTLDGKFIAEFPSVASAAKSLGVCSSTICTVCVGRGNTAHGFIWRYSDDINRKKVKRPRPGTPPKYGESESTGGRRGKIVHQYTKEGRFVRAFASLTEAGAVIGVHPSAIGNVCKRHPTCRTAGGYIWRYATDDEFL